MSDLCELVSLEKECLACAKYFDRKIIMPAKYYARKNIFSRRKPGGPDRPMFWQSILTLLVARQSRNLSDF